MVQEELLPMQDKALAEAFSLGKGYFLKWESQTLLTVFRYGVPFKHTEFKTSLDRRRFVVELIQEAGVAKGKVAEALNISRQSIDNWLSITKKSGFEGLVNSYKGSREKGRRENGANLPCGNKARQLEAERREQKEMVRAQQLSIHPGVVELGDQTVTTELFQERYEFEENRYAGGFLYWGIFQNVFDFMGFCGSWLGKSADVVFLFSMMLVQAIPSVEQLKVVYKKEFGRLLGLKHLVNRNRVWSIIHEACDLKISSSLLDAFYNRQVRLSLVSLYWLYLDGHFVPYYGKEHVHKGFYTQRDLMMPGQTEFYVHDCQGHIVYSDIQEGKGDIKEMMRTIGRKWLLEGMPPLVVVDREAWGVEHFLSLEGCRYVTWEKFSDSEELGSIAGDKFGPVFRLHGKDYQAFEDRKQYKDVNKKSIELRRIVIWNHSTGKRVACVTSDDQEKTEGIALAMLGRWGSSENGLKYMGERWNSHYNPVYDASRESEKQEHLNPAFKMLKNDLKRLKTQLGKAERDMGRLKLTTNKDGTIRKSKRRDRLSQKISWLKEKLNETEEQLKTCPERINYAESAPDERYRVLAKEGKNLWNLSQSLVWNSRRHLINLVKAFILDQRDLIPAVEAMTRCRGWVRSRSEVVEVRFEPLDTPRYRAAQIQLCRVLNEREIRFPNGKRILYDVGACPENVQKKS